MGGGEIPMPDFVAFELEALRGWHAEDELSINIRTYKKKTNG